MASVRRYDATYTYEHSGRYKVTLTVTARTATATASDITHDGVGTGSVGVAAYRPKCDRRAGRRLRAYGLTQGTLVIPLRDTGVNQEPPQNLAQSC